MTVFEAGHIRYNVFRGSSGLLNGAFITGYRIKIATKCSSLLSKSFCPTISLTGYTLNNRFLDLHTKPHILFSPF